MTIKYKFVTGEEVYVEVYGRLEKVMTKLAHAEKVENNEYEKKKAASLRKTAG